MGKSGNQTGKLLLSIAGFAFGALNPAAFGMKSSAWLMGGLYGASLASSVWSATNKPDEQKQKYNFDQLMNQVDPNIRIPLIYGTRKWAGQQTWHEASKDKQTLTKDIVWCEGDISGISDIRANDLDIRTLDGCSYTFSDGSTSAKPPDNFDKVGGYRRMAWSRFTLKSSDKLTGNNPTLTAIIKGKKIVDTRTNTYDYSSNPAMCVRDYLLSKRYGAGHFISAGMLDENSFKEIADYNDALVTSRVPTTLSTADAINAKITELNRYLAANPNVSTTEHDNIADEITRLTAALNDIQNNPVDYTLDVSPRHSLNIIITETKSHREILQDMLATFGGFLVYTNGKVSLRCEKETPVSYAFNNDNICEKPDYTEYPIDQTPNRYYVKFYDPANEWTGVRVLCEDTVAQKSPPVGVGKIIPKEVDLIGCTSQAQALRLARLYRDKNLCCPGVISFTTAMQAMHLEPGDVVTVSWKVVIDGVEQWLYQDIPVRILQIARDKGTYSIKAEQYNSSIYNDSLGAEIQTKNYIVNNLPTTPIAITNVIAKTNTDDELLITHDESTDYNFAEYRYYIEEVET
jgi:hypothetical protein